ncbi:YbaB/EbfC family nucleoid-associated protein [Mycoplasma zalophi]|uniref:Nucleoid-associated protein KQ875_02120 n=1 Tax=Mycoplasma zalophi TaxID=191287 RepID=A0ABS6DPZ3_9MOLU|nr:YbaB/EbfC family nucleoid-associated protein [Mycoplasma zalophi]MBU4690794.1 YbaB/EbfC family nucleoid-associated protein [Mycoplasma zalophi]MBU4692390.1 YbaB/EbfC family nucleoid-associated protein [Mycoplasma zalophi]
MNIQEMLKQAKKMQSEMELKEKEIAKKEFVVEKMGITLTILGSRKLKSVKINEALIDPDDPETLEDLIVVAFNDAMETIDKAYEELSQSLPQGNLPF